MALRRIRRRVNASMSNLDNAVDRIEQAALAVLDELADILEEGVSFRLTVAGRQIPVRLVLEPDESDSADPD